MEELIKTIEKNRRLIVITVAALMFVLFGFCPAVDIYGKAQAGGFEVLLEGEGLGFPRFLSVLILIVPIFIIADKFINLKLPNKIGENSDAAAFIAGVILCLFFAVTLPEGTSLAWGGWLYVVLSILGSAVSCLDKFARK